MWVNSANNRGHVFKFFLSEDTGIRQFTVNQWDCWAYQSLPRLWLLIFGTVPVHMMRWQGLDGYSTTHSNGFCKVMSWGSKLLPVSCEQSMKWVLRQLVIWIYTWKFIFSPHTLEIRKATGAKPISSPLL